MKGKIYSDRTDRPKTHIECFTYWTHAADDPIPQMDIVQRVHVEPNDQEWEFVNGLYGDVPNNYRSIQAADELADMMVEQGLRRTDP